VPAPAMLATCRSNPPRSSVPATVRSVLSGTAPAAPCLSVPLFTVVVPAQVLAWFNVSKPPETTKLMLPVIVPAKAPPLVTVKVTKVAFELVTTPAPVTLASGSQDRTARIWDAGTGKQLAVFRGHTGEVTAARFGADGQQVLPAQETCRCGGGRNRFDEIAAADLAAANGDGCLDVSGHSFRFSVFSFQPLRAVKEFGGVDEAPEDVLEGLDAVADLFCVLE